MRPWTVAPHTPLQQIDENLWILEGTFPENKAIVRTMHVLKRSDGTLLFHNAVTMNEETEQQLRALGTPAVLVVPSPSHVLDIHPFKERLGVEVYCPAPILELVKAKVEVKGTLDQLPKDPSMEVITLKGTNTGESVILAKSPDGSRTHFITADAVLNLKSIPGVIGIVMKLVGATGGPRVGPFFKWKAITDKKAFREHLISLAGTAGLASVLPSHGPPIRNAPADAVREAAVRL